MRRQQSEAAWGTLKELAWIERIGFTSNELKTKYLEGYINSCKNRVKWGEGLNYIDKNICLKRANELLMRLRNGY